MRWKTIHQEEYELARENTHESEESVDFEADDGHTQSHLLTGQHVSLSRWNAASLLFQSVLPSSLYLKRSRRKSKHCRLTFGWLRSRRSLFAKLVLLSYIFLAFVIALTITCAIFFPSYTYPPDHYRKLRDHVRSSNTPGRGNPNQEKVFIAATIYDRDGKLASGAWSRGLLDLIDLLGPNNVYLSIYENNAGAVGRETLEDFEVQVTCNHTIKFDENLVLDDLPHVTLPDGSKRVKRIAYLAEVRNRALLPLETADVRFDKLLYVNDVVFNPVDVVQLLFSTNADEDGRANYRAACAVDFIDPFKFYDTFATRDLEGHSIGIPIFPWFSASGEAQSRLEVIRGKDGVRVRSCWGGMIAYDARYFQKPLRGQAEPDTAGHRSPKTLSIPYRFRAEEELFWDASECCLINADIQSSDPFNTGIFMNPFVRVAYTTRTLSWLGLMRRFERLYTPIQFLLDILVGLPHYNPRRDEQSGQLVEDSVWVSDGNVATGGSFQMQERIANHAGFCGFGSLHVMRENTEEGEKPWEKIPVPS